MEKLTIKELAPYLPYGLKGIYCGHGDPCKNAILSSLHFNHPNKWECSVELEGETDTDVLFYFKPILRPLSDLTEEIEVNGNKLVIASMLWSIEVQEEEAFEVYGEIPEYWKHCIEQVKKGRMDYNDMTTLFKYHFDCFGLIEKGLAIDINTINKQIR